MAIILRCICISSHVVHFKYIQSLFAHHTSVKLERKRYQIFGFFYSLVVGNDISAATIKEIHICTHTHTQPQTHQLRLCTYKNRNRSSKLIGNLKTGSHYKTICKKKLKMQSIAISLKEQYIFF